MIKIKTNIVLSNSEGVKNEDLVGSSLDLVIRAEWKGLRHFDKRRDYLNLKPCIDFGMMRSQFMPEV